MKKIIVFLLVLLSLVVIFLIAVEIYKNAGDGNADIEGDRITGDVVKDDSGTDSISGNVVEGSGSGGGSSESKNNPETASNGLPSDLNTRPCSFYFMEYGVCAGACPGGQCLADGKSCYCQIV